MTLEDSTRCCKNCGASLEAEFCSRCGQRDIDFRRDWRGLTGEFFSSVFNLDGRVPRGIFELLFRPGHNVRLFLQGKRMSQIPPLRLFLFSSLIYFIWLTSGGSNSIAEAFSEGIAEEMSEESGWEGDESMFGRSLVEDPDAVMVAFNNWLPRVFLLSVPALALVTRFLFRKRGFVLLEHLVVAMQLLTFVMLWKLLISAIAKLSSFVSPTFSDYIEYVLAIWMLIYPVIALRRVFSLSWPKSMVATLFLLPLFIALFGIGVAAVMVLAIGIS
ncbi:DUF3667 domain-containing protein [Pelagicoccus enzymogenes]|uniref:DUF3667 domain-containing protein n=1 Tax=Pelagicoccus enzymogenes TaxID=2773457 RepID=UPI00280DD403|nr:DUF3667 domain-containing protein [Pelagicoccus enzymogenes]MDQ8197467.1 DUF3667 domain-containing protein [Pelagicoccus enzymogenes]